MKPDQARNFVGPDLGPNFLHMLSADDTLCYFCSFNKQIQVMKQIIQSNNE